MNSAKKVQQAFQKYRSRFSLGQRFGTKTRSNFLNFIKKVEGEDGSACVMKVPRAFTDIFCYLRIAVFHLLGDKGIIYGASLERIKNEKEKIRLLNEKGIPSLPLVKINADRALVTKFVKGANLKDIFYDNTMPFEEKLKILAKCCERLEDIHACFSHGDAQIRNSLLTEDNDVIWLDYEYIINPDMPDIKKKARDLIFLTVSAVKHLGAPDEVVKTIFNAYKGDDVKKAIPFIWPYQGIGYNLFLNFLNPVICLKVRRSLRKAGY